MFSPRSVAVIGASSLPGKWGFILPINLMTRGYAGRLYLVNNRARSVLGHRTYNSILDVDDEIDLALVAVPAPSVPAVIRECGRKKIKNAVIISANFKETGEQGEKLQQDLIEQAAEYDIRVIGPNCMGICCPKSNLFAMGAPTAPPEGKIAFVSQSGNLGIQLLGWAENAGMGISRFISSGNEAVTKSHQILEFYGADPDTEVIIMYLEGISDGEKFLDMARKVSRTKPIIAFKIGKTEAGAKAARSHSGSVAGSREIFEAAVKQAGIIEARSTEELVDLARSMSELPMPKGKRVAVMTLGGGWGVVAADQCAERGLQLPELSEKTFNGINEFLPDFWSHNNPVDLVGSIRRANHHEAMRLLSEDDKFDSLIVLGSLMGGNFDKLHGVKMAFKFISSLFRNVGPRAWLLIYQVAKGWRQLAVDAEAARKAGRKKADTASQQDRLDPSESRDWGTERFSEIVQEVIASSGKPLLPVAIDASSLAQFYKDYGLVAFGVPEKAVNVLAGMVQYAEYLKMLEAEDAVEQENGFTPDLKRAEAVWKSAGPIISEHEAKQLLSCFGISVVPERPARTADEATAAAVEIGYPVAIKIDSPDILHKTEAGGVELNLRSDQDVKIAFDKIMAAASEYKPDADIKGVLVQKMAGAGAEVMIGATRDPHFGPAMVFGLGGIFVEALGDVSLRLPPLARFDARAMINEIRGRKMLEGFRGAPPADIDSLARTIFRAGLLVHHFRDRIEEMDINPLLAGPDGALALDAMIVKAES
jgi:acetyltransferase